ncbi:hypothetical protein CFAM422_006466 [Trichoderma lentiforme]|uniref:Uncharacterized protein n=1 Tax=Trichoderma lentiforme TaxID=1567552 RepID=A0A9P4XCS3_9HYPO|nr:hypothetical protein CFAM422_006466 [Trichoderma lentiforme]
MESYGVVKSRTEGFILAVCRIHDQLLDEMDHTEAAEQGGYKYLRSTQSAVAIGNEAHESKLAGESVILLVFCSCYVARFIHRKLTCMTGCDAWAHLVGCAPKMG